MTNAFYFLYFFVISWRLTIMISLIKIMSGETVLNMATINSS
jgi:hypothetical protein